MNDWGVGQYRFQTPKNKKPRGLMTSRGFRVKPVCCFVRYVWSAPATNIRVVGSPRPLMKFSPALRNLPPELRCMRKPVPNAGNARTHERAACCRARVVKVRGVVMAKRTPEICEPCLGAVTHIGPQGLKLLSPKATIELCMTTNAESETI